MSEETLSFWRTPSGKGHLRVIGGSVCISFAALFVQGAPIDPSMVAFYRLLFGGLVLGAVAVWRRERLVPPRGVLWFMLAAGVFFAGDLIAWHACIVRLGPGLATIIGNFQVFFIALFGALFLKEPLSWRHKLAIPLALAGLTLLLEADPRSLPPQVAAGIAFGMVSASLYTGYILTLRQSQTERVRLPAIANMSLISLISAAATGLFCASFSISFAIPDARTGLTIAALGILCQALGWVLLSTGLPLMPASRAGLVMLIQPTLSFIWDILFCGRPTGLVGLTGAVVAIGAIGLGLASPKTKPAQPAE